MSLLRLLTTLFVLLSIFLEVKCEEEETTYSTVNPESSSLYNVVTEPESSQTGIFLITLTILILLLPFIGICCYLVNIRYRFVIFDLFFKRRKPDDDVLQCKRFSHPGSFYHRLSDVNTGVGDYVNRKLLKLYPEVKRFGDELPPAFRLQKNVLLVPENELSPSCVEHSQAEAAGKMESDLLIPPKTDIKITVEFVEDTDQGLEHSKEAKSVQSNIEV